MLKLAHLFSWIEDHEKQFMLRTGQATVMLLPFCFICMVLFNLLKTFVFGGDGSFAKTTPGALLVFALASIVMYFLWKTIRGWVDALKDRHFGGGDWDEAPEKDDYSDYEQRGIHTHSPTT